MMTMVGEKEIFHISGSCESVDSENFQRMHVFSSRPTKTSFGIHSVKKYKKQEYEKTGTKKLYKKNH